MQKLTTPFSALLLTLAATVVISGCSSNSNSNTLSFPGAYKIDIQQGNVISQESIEQLRPGLTRSQVIYLLGTPLLQDSFNQNSWHYIFNLIEGNGNRTQRTISVYFKNDAVTEVKGDLVEKHTETKE